MLGLGLKGTHLLFCDLYRNGDINEEINYVVSNNLNTRNEMNALDFFNREC